MYPTEEAFQELKAFKQGYFTPPCAQVLTYVTDRIKQGCWEPKSYKEWTLFLHQCNSCPKYQLKWRTSREECEYRKALVTKAYPQDWSSI